MDLLSIVPFNANIQRCIVFTGDERVVYDIALILNTAKVVYIASSDGPSSVKMTRSVPYIICSTMSEAMTELDNKIDLLVFDNAITTENKLVATIKLLKKIPLDNLLIVLRCPKDSMVQISDIMTSIAKLKINITMASKIERIRLIYPDERSYRLIAGA